jgi:hypothetical protein
MTLSIFDGRDAQLQGGTGTWKKYSTPLACAVQMSVRCRRVSSMRKRLCCPACTSERGPIDADVARLLPL